MITKARQRRSHSQVETAFLVLVSPCYRSRPRARLLLNSGVRRDGSHPKNFPTGNLLCRRRRDSLRWFMLATGNSVITTTLRASPCSNEHRRWNEICQFSVSGNNTVTSRHPQQYKCGWHRVRGGLRQYDFWDDYLSGQECPSNHSLDSGGTPTSFEPGAGTTLNSLSGCGGQTKMLANTDWALYFPIKRQFFRKRDGAGYLFWSCLKISR